MMSWATNYERINITIIYLSSTWTLFTQDDLQIAEMLSDWTKFWLRFFAWSVVIITVKWDRRCTNLVNRWSWIWSTFQSSKRCSRWSWSDTYRTRQADNLHTKLLSYTSITYEQRKLSSITTYTWTLKTNIFWNGKYLEEPTIEEQTINNLHIDLEYISKNYSSLTLYVCV